MNKAENKAELQYSVSAIKGILSNGSAVEITDGMAVAITAATEYFISEILELAGNAARDGKRMRITVEFIKVAIEKDIELKETFSMMTTVADYSLPTFHTQTVRLLRLVHPQTSITGEASEYIDGIIHTFVKDCSNQIQLGVTDLSTIMHTILYGQLAGHAENESTKAIHKYKTWTPSTVP